MSDQRSRRRSTVAWCIVVLTIGMLAAWRPQTAAAQKGRDLFDEIYERGRPVESTLKTLTASFVETSTSTLLARPLTARGTVTVERPSRVVLDYTEPDVRRVLIDGSLLLVTWPSRSIRQQQDIGAAQGRVQKYFVGKSPAELRRHFKIAAREAPDRNATWHVEMIPTRKQLLEGVSRIELWIAHETVLPVSMRLTFPNGDTKLMEFSGVKVNPVLPQDTFSPRRN
jgi:outer membrane lipoprotein-sorting protein